MSAEMSFSWAALLLFFGVSSAAFSGSDDRYPPGKGGAGNGGAGRYEETLNVLMPNVMATAEDQYVCASQPVERELYIVDFIPKASMQVVHHMLLYGCGDVDRSQLDGRYNVDCESECLGNNVILFAWARNAASPTIPADVGFHIGGDSGINYLTLQIHYGDLNAFRDGRKDTSGLALTVTPIQQMYLGGILLSVGMDIEVLPNVNNAHTDIACTYRSRTPIYAFAFRTHAHGLGKVITGYRIRDNSWEMIAKGNPQWPQAFYPMSQIYEIKEHDVVATRCTFDGTRTDHTVHVGSTHNDEMCNLYIMYYTNADRGEAFKVCSIEGSSSLFSHIPPGSDYVPPEMPRMDDAVDDDDASDDTNPQETMDVVLDEVEDNNLLGEVGREETSTPTPVINDDEDATGSRVLNVVPDWAKDLKLGQVGGVDTDSNDNLQLFHRSDRTWDFESFDREFHYIGRQDEIKEDTVLVMDQTGKLLSSWGANLFYLPHGLFVDHDDNIWLTDVALHQVFKFAPDQLTRPLLTLGTRLQPGEDASHFCQPADVVVNPKDGSFFVADGYCNSRIVKYSASAQILLVIDNSAIQHLSPPSMLLVHSLTMAHQNEHVCACDRQNGRILCFDARSGQFLRQIMLEEFAGIVFAAQYSPMRGGVLFVVNGASALNKPVLGITVNYTTGTVLETWAPTEGFSMPHDVTVSSDANVVYVGGIDTSRETKIWKFVDPVPDTETRTESRSHLERNLERDSLLNHGGVAGKGGADNPAIDTRDSGTTAVILAVLAVPILLMIMIAVMVRLQAQGRLNTGRGIFVARRRGQQRDNFSIGNFFNKKKGFSQVSTDDSDQEAATWSEEESDVEEYSILNSKRTQNL